MRVSPTGPDLLGMTDADRLHEMIDELRRMREQCQPSRTRTRGTAVLERGKRLAMDHRRPAKENRA